MVHETTLKTNRLFRDTNAWYHVVITFDTTQSTQSDRIKMWINGVQETSFASATYPSQDATVEAFNSVNTFEIGRYSVGNSEFFDGLLSHCHMTVGYAYPASTFGSTDSTTGEWKINTSPSVTYGTNGFFILKDGNSVTDQSGNSNNFTVGGGTLTNTEDNPSNSFATWNRMLPMNSTFNLNYGNTSAKTGNTYGDLVSNSWISTLGMSSGKFYAEFKLTQNSSSTAGEIGVLWDIDNAQRGSSGNAYRGSYEADGWGYAMQGEVQHNASAQNTDYSSYGTNDIVGVAVDVDNSKLYFSKNGTWQGSSNPSAGTGGISITSGKEYFFMASDGSGVNTYTYSANFGNGNFRGVAISSEGTNASGIGKFEYDVPTGFTALSTKGLNE